MRLQVGLFICVLFALGGSTYAVDIPFDVVDPYDMVFNQSSSWTVEGRTYVSVRNPDGAIVELDFDREAIIPVYALGAMGRVHYAQDGKLLVSNWNRKDGQYRREWLDVLTRKTENATAVWDELTMTGFSGDAVGLAIEGEFFLAAMRPPKSRHVVLVSWNEKTKEIRSIKYDNIELRATDYPTIQISPSGDRVLFASYDGLFLIDAGRDSVSRLLAAGQSDPTKMCGFLGRDATYSGDFTKDVVHVTRIDGTRVADVRFVNKDYSIRSIVFSRDLSKAFAEMSTKSQAGNLCALIDTTEFQKFLRRMRIGE